MKMLIRIMEKVQEKREIEDKSNFIYIINKIYKDLDKFVRTISIKEVRNIEYHLKKIRNKENLLLVVQVSLNHQEETENLILALKILAAIVVTEQEIGADQEIKVEAEVEVEVEVDKELEIIIIGPIQGPPHPLQAVFK